MIHDRGSDMIRGDHGSVWVGFVPNLRPNRPSWVPIFQTRRQPVRKSDQIRRFLPESGRVSIGVDYLENGENPAKKIWKTAVSSEEILKNGRNPARSHQSNEILAIFGKILARSSKISPDLA